MEVKRQNARWKRRIQRLQLLPLPLMADVRPSVRPSFHRENEVCATLHNLWLVLSVDSSQWCVTHSLRTQLFPSQDTLAVAVAAAARCSASEAAGAAGAEAVKS